MDLANGTVIKIDQASDATLRLTNAEHYEVRRSESQIALNQSEKEHPAERPRKGEWTVRQVGANFQTCVKVTQQGVRQCRVS